MASNVAADHYNRRGDHGRGRRSERDATRHRKLSNWVKSVLLKRFVVVNGAGGAVLDLACGKGGDLYKFATMAIRSYVGVDIAKVSVDHARERYNKMDRKVFGARFFAADCFAIDLPRFLADGLGMDESMLQFDAVSCQFALHYSFESEERVRRALSNISRLLKPGGTFVGTSLDYNVIIRGILDSKNGEFGNEYFQVRAENKRDFENLENRSPFGIKYHFYLVDAVDCPEFLLPIPILEKIASEYELDLMRCDNFHRFFYKYADEKQYPDNVALLNKTGVLDQNGTMEEAQWNVAYLYLAFVFKKRRSNHSRPESNGRFALQPRSLRSEDIVVHPDLQ